MKKLFVRMRPVVPVVVVSRFINRVVALMLVYALLASEGLELSVQGQALSGSNGLMDDAPAYIGMAFIGLPSPLGVPLPKG